MRTHLLAASCLALAATAAHAEETAPARDAWTSSGAYAGVSGGFVAGGGNGDFSSFNTRDARYNDDISVAHGWQSTAEGGAVLPLGSLDWMRLRVGGEVGYSQFSLDSRTDSFSGDTVSGKAGLWRIGPAAALDFRVKRTPWSFTVGAGAGAAFVDLDASVTHGGASRDAGDHFATPYASILGTVNYALDKNTDLTLGLRGVALADAHVRGTDTSVGGTTYSVRHHVNGFGAIEMGLRFTF